MRNKFFILICLIILFWNCVGLSKRNINEKQNNQIHYQAFPQINGNDEYGIQVNLSLPNSLFVFQKINDQFIAKYQISIAILDSTGQRINHFSWQGENTESYFEDTRNINNSISSGYFFKIIPGKYSISILIEDLDSKYRWLKEISLKKFQSEFISPIFVIPNKNSGNINNYAGNIIPDKTEKIFINISHNFEKLSNQSFIKIKATNDNEIVLTDSILIDQQSNTIKYPILISEYWLGELILEFKYNSFIEKLNLKLPRNISQYWKDIGTTIQIMSYIFTSKEYRQVRTLSKKEKVEFVKDYWKKLDPTPETEINEVMDEFFQRIEFSSSNFSELGPGWQSDRGHVYIIFGPPEQKLETLNFNDFQDTLMVNSLSGLKIIQLILNVAKKNTLEMIVNISSDAGSMTKNNQGNAYIYRTSKSALNSLTKNMSVDLFKNYNIIVF